jgi:hypothetical protein
MPLTPRGRSPARANASTASSRPTTRRGASPCRAGKAALALALGDRAAARRWLAQAIPIQEADRTQPPAVLAEMKADLALARRR